MARGVGDMKSHGVDDDEDDEDDINEEEDRLNTTGGGVSEMDMQFDIRDTTFFFTLVRGIRLMGALR